MSHGGPSTYPLPSATASASLHGRVCVVTGASRGIGKATAVELARGGATVVTLCRDPASGARAVDEARNAGARSGGDAGLVVCDLASFASIRAAAAEISARWPRLHVLINNAGVSLVRRSTTVDDIETTLAVNHLAPFLLTHLLLPLLRASAPARVVNVSSELERWGRIDFANLQGQRRYNGTRAYLQSKLATVLFTTALAERLTGTGITVNCVYPGLVATDLLREHWWWRARWLRPLWRRLFLTPHAAAATAVWAATAPEIAAVSGACFAGGGRRVRTSRRSRDRALGTRLWEWSARATGLASGSSR